LILSSLVLVTLGVASLTVQEIRASRASFVAEPAINAAETGAEAGLWSIKRPGASLADCASSVSPTPMASGMATVLLCKSYGSTLISLKAGVDSSFYLYNPNNQNGDIDLISYPYTRLTITPQSSVSVGITASRLDGSVNGISPSSTTASISGATINISPVVAGQEGRIKVILSAASDVLVNVDTDRGMPGYPIVDATGCSGKVALSACSSASQDLFTRRIKVTVPQ
jgi:hypothetical protein